MGSGCSSLSWICCHPSKQPSVHPSAAEAESPEVCEDKGASDPDQRNVIQKNFGEDISPQSGANSGNNKVFFVT